MPRSPIDLESKLGRRFVTDCTRAAEGLTTDREVQEKYELSDSDWQVLTVDRKPIRAIQAERELRLRNGTAACESAARHFVHAPNVLNEIMTGAQSNPRHKIEAVRELRQVAVGGDGVERPTESERFIIRIDLTAGGGDVTTIDKPLLTINTLTEEGKRVQREERADGD
jgi:hypothetical protein